jgi:hypothetical protein
MKRPRITVPRLTVICAVIAAGSLAAFMAASAGVAGSRATNANANPVAGYLAVGNDVNVNFDHVEAYIGAQDSIGDLGTTIDNGVGIGLCNSNTGGTNGPALQMGIVKQADGSYQVEYAYGDNSNTNPEAQTSGDNCEDGALGSFAPGDVHNTYNGGLTAPTFAFGNVEEMEIQYLHGHADFSYRQITADNPGPWFTTGWVSVLPPSCQFNEAEIGVDADTTGLVGPADRTLAPFAHATVSSETFAQRHRSDQGFFDTAPNGEWTAIPVSSYPNGNSSDAAVLAPNGLHNGNGGLLEGSPVG